MSSIDETSAIIVAVADRVGPAVVSIGRRHRGSGVVVAEGRVLTNSHNLRGEEVTLTFADGRVATGRLSAADHDGDLAVVAAETTGIAPVEWSDGPPAVGDAVLGVSATSGGGPRVTLGFVSALGRAFRGPGGRRISGSIEHTAPMARGSSGGPIVDASGRLVGINTNRLGDGFYLAVPADTALQDRVAALARGEAPSRPRLGIAVAPSMVARRLRRSVGLSERDGLLVRGVEDGSPADRAGIAEGDLIVAAAGQAVTDVDALGDVLASTQLPIDLVIVRGDAERTVSVGGDGAATGEA